MEDRPMGGETLDVQGVIALQAPQITALALAIHAITLSGLAESSSEILAASGGAACARCYAFEAWSIYMLNACGMPAKWQTCYSSNDAVVAIS